MPDDCDPTLRAIARAATVAANDESLQDTVAREVPAAVLRLRRARPAEILLPRTRAWLDALPESVFPRQLAQSFPRVVNQIAFCWGSPAERAQELVSLINDRRGNRRGFPAKVKDELRRLLEWQTNLDDKFHDHWHG